MAETVILGQFLSGSLSEEVQLDFPLRTREKFSIFLVFGKKIV